MDKVLFANNFDISKNLSLQVFFYRNTHLKSQNVERAQFFVYINLKNEHVGKSVTCYSNGILLDRQRLCRLKTISENCFLMSN